MLPSPLANSPGWNVPSCCVHAWLDAVVFPGDEEAAGRDRVHIHVTLLPSSKRDSLHLNIFNFARTA